MSYNRLTWAQVKASRLPVALDMCSSVDEPRLLQLINEAQKRILDRSEQWGLAVRYRSQATEGRLVWPRPISAILAVAYGLGTDNGVTTPYLRPAKMRDEFFEFLGTGMGIQDKNNSSDQYLPRGNSCLFAEIQGTTNKVGVYCDLNDDNAASAAPVDVLLLGYDDNANWIRDNHDALGAVVAWHDGEYVRANNTTPYGALSIHKFSQITGVQKPICNGSIRLYQVDPVALTQVPLARYDYDETDPWYPVSIITDLDNYASVASPATVEVVARLNWMPVNRDTDYLTISNLPALKDVCSAILAAEREPLMREKESSIAKGLAMAQSALEGEYRRQRGRSDLVMPVAGMGGPTECAVLNLL